MDWSGAKNWLILLFACLNIFLIAMLISVSTHSSKLDKDTIEKTVEVLSNNGISVEKSVIPDKIPKLNSVEVSNAVADKDAFAASLLGNDFKKEGDKYFTDTKSVQFSQNKFLYTNSAPNENYSDINLKTAAEKASAFLSELGSSTASATNTAGENNGTYTVEFSQQLDKYPLFDSYITVKLSQDGVSLVEGSWFFTSSDQSSVTSAATRVAPSTSALIDFISDPTRIANNSNKITEISIGYTAGENTEYHTFASAIPVWRIKTDDGHLYYFDAR